MGFDVSGKKQTDFHCVIDTQWNQICFCPEPSDLWVTTIKVFDTEWTWKSGWEDAALCLKYVQVAEQELLGFL